MISDAHEGLKAAIRRRGWRLVAALPSALDAQRAVLRAEGAAEHGVGRACARRSSNPTAPNAGQTLRHVADQLRAK